MSELSARIVVAAWFGTSLETRRSLVSPGLFSVPPGFDGSTRARYMKSLMIVFAAWFRSILETRRRQRRVSTGLAKAYFSVPPGFDGFSGHPCRRVFLPLKVGNQAGASGWIKKGLNK